MTLSARPSLRQKLQIAFSSIPKLSKRARWIAGLLVLLVVVGGFSAYKFIYLPSQATHRGYSSNFGRPGGQPGDFRQRHRHLDRER